MSRNLQTRVAGRSRREAKPIVYLAGCGCSVCELAEWFCLPVDEVIAILRNYG